MLGYSQQSESDSYLCYTHRVNQVQPIHIGSLSVVEFENDLASLNRSTDIK